MHFLKESWNLRHNLEYRVNSEGKISIPDGISKNNSLLTGYTWLKTQLSDNCTNEKARRTFNTSHRTVFEFLLAILHSERNRQALKEYQLKGEFFFHFFQ